jgi:CRP-like cAMP-binding protein
MHMQTPKPIVSEHPLLRSLSTAHLGALAECAEAREFREGEVIFLEGDIADRFYLIESGKVVLETHTGPRGTLAVQELGAGDVLGWSWLFPPHAWRFQARALERAVTWVISGRRMVAACERDHEFGYDVMKRLAQALIRRLQATQKELVVQHVQHPEYSTV